MLLVIIVVAVNVDHPEVDTNKCCVFPFLRLSGALRGWSKSSVAAAPLELRLSEERKYTTLISFHLRLGDLSYESWNSG